MNHRPMRSTTPLLLRLTVRPLSFCAAILVILTVIGCESGMSRIDRATDNLVRQTSREIGGGAVPPRVEREDFVAGSALRYPSDRDTFNPGTVNPPAAELAYTPEPAQMEEFDPAIEAQDAIDRLEQSLAEPPADALRLDLSGTLAQAIRTSREYRTAEEEYILSALRLLIERHRWGPRFFDEVSADIAAIGEDDKFDTALSLVNELRVTQRLPYGGEVSARLLARATEDLHQRIAGPEGTQSADVILSANIPLLRGAGLAAREPRIQAERDLIYAARGFEQFRRDFLVDIATTFLDLVVQQQNITNTKNELENRLSFYERERALMDAGRASPFNAALAANSVLDTRDNLRSQIDNYTFAVDRFKVRLGLPVDQPVIIMPGGLDLPAPRVTSEEAVMAALTYRLDVQTQRDRIDDARRSIDIARNNLLPDLDFSASANITTDDERDRAGLRFNTEDNDYSAGITFGLPLDREIERLQLRQTQINFEQAKRNYDRFRDDVVVSVRQAIREIERARFSLRLQEENLEIAQLRQDSIEAAPDRATALDRSEAADALTRAANARDRAVRDLEVAILEYLLTTGMLRVDSDGNLIPPPGARAGDTLIPAVDPAGGLPPADELLNAQPEGENQ